MTNESEKAIKLLMELRICKDDCSVCKLRHLDGDTHCHHEKALNLAIKALEQQPCEDCISREAVKEMLSDEWTKYMPMELDINLSFVMEKINELPSVTPKAESKEGD